MGRARHVTEGFYHLRCRLPEIAYGAIHVADDGEPVLDHVRVPCAW
jgi:hypothetical protein